MPDQHDPLLSAARHRWGEHTLLSFDPERKAWRPVWPQSRHRLSPSEAERQRTVYVEWRNSVSETRNTVSSEPQTKKGKDHVGDEREHKS